MREITIGDKTIRVRATPLALLFYKQEFKSDLIGDLLSMHNMANDPSQFDALKFLQLIWAMAKADKPEGFPSFEAWLSGMESFDFADNDITTAVIEEATDGFFVEVESSGEATDTESDPPERMDLQLLVVGKKMGLTFDEINMFRVCDLLKYVQIYTGNDEETEVRQANQSDFDSF